MLTDLQKKTAMAVVNLFETGRVRGDYGKVTLLAGDSGHLTYGRSQTTLASGNLYLLIKAYCAAPEAARAAPCAAFLERLEAADLSLDHDDAFHALLHEAGDDPVMRSVQDDFFDRVYWAPAIRSAEHIGVASALGTAVVYDGHVHGSWHRMRDRTDERHGRLADLNEEAWIGFYVDERHAWLASHSNTLLQRTTYRMECFRQLIGAGNWSLALPLVAHGRTIDEAALLAAPVVRASAAVAEERLLRLRQPFMQGQDVRELQEALRRADIEIEPDGVFGPATKEAMIALQRVAGLVADGIVGAATRSQLSL